MNSSMTPDAAAGVDPFAAAGAALPALDNTFGALVIGTYIALIQYGWMLHQGYQYYSLYKDDMLMLKLLVALVLYYYLVSNYFNPLALQSAVWSIEMMGVTTVRSDILSLSNYLADADEMYQGATIFFSQLFFLRRVYKFGRKFIPIVIFVGLLLLSELGLATAASVDTFVNNTLHDSNQSWMNSAGVGICSLADSILTATLIYSLRRSRTGVHRTDSLIDLLILYAINTGMVTLIVNTLSFILALTMPNNLIYVAVDFIATKLYANTLLAVLVSRRYLAAQTTGGVVHSTSIDLGPASRNMRSGGSHNHHTGVTVETKTFVTSANHPPFFQGDAESDKYSHAV
ncbi:uncharacterized protein BXZ73DRAFT_76339 [Epithele typhae]|uniref:uncharacterized protein n=1 Tax=Epithele typhae TaxID=378194 RepID=UPI002008873D|nr:uncharacterized protein BXZ73DRAFT_76339 [Epithele typhae]KAH9938836.1 hypothetical protein BXZ73DRAFT_76339 [Epithele typhae]